MRIMSCPKIDRTREELDREELAVFRQFVGEVDSMMICHGWYPCFEPTKNARHLCRSGSSQNCSATKWASTV